MRIAWPATVAVVLLLAGVAPTDARRQGAAGRAEEKVKDDGTFLRHHLAVEARGMIKMVDGRIFVVARQRMIVQTPGKDFGLVERTETVDEVTRELVFGDRKELRERAEKLLGKTVIVTGTAEMLLVRHFYPGEGGHARAPSHTWEIESKVLVTELKAVP
jgi:hypothetical protein